MTEQENLLAKKITEFSGVVLGQLPDDSVLDVKLSGTVGQIKERFTSYKADTTSKFNSMTINILYPPTPLVGAKGDGITDDIIAINNIIAWAPIGSTIFFPNKKYIISAKIIVGKRLTIVGEHCYTTNIQNNGTDDAIVLNDAETTIKNFLISGNTLSKSGLVIANESCRAENVFSTDNGEHGIKLMPGIWVVNLYKCQTFHNVKSGIYAVSGGGANNQQLNAINIKDCHSWLNTEHGIVITATSTNIKDNVIEQNLKSGIFVTTLTFNIYDLNIYGNYFEGNKNGHISFDLHPSLGFRLYVCNIGGNYFYLESSQVNAGVTSIINATTDLLYDGIDNIFIDKTNFFLTSTLKHVSLGNSISSVARSKIYANSGDSVDFSALYDSLGTCGIDNNQKSLVLNGYFYAKGITYSSLEKSSNIITTLGTDSASYPILFPSGKQYKKTGVYITTDSTMYSVVFTVSKRSANGTALFVGMAYASVAGNVGNKYVEMPDIRSLSDPNGARIQGNEECYLLLQFSNTGGGTNFQVGNPIVTYTE